MTQDLVKSAARTLEIMEAFAADRRPLTAAQLGQSLGYPRSSLNVLLKSLVAQGYLSSNTLDLSYFPTLKLTHLGDWIPSAIFGSNSLMPMLEELRDVTGETVTLSMATGLHMRCLRALPGRHPIALQLDEGLLFPIFDSAVGRAYLSTLADDDIDKLLQQHNARRPRGAALSRAAVTEVLEQVRRDGTSIAYDKVVPDTGAVAIALQSPEQGEMLVVAVAGLNSRVKRSEAQIIRQLRQWCRRVE